MGLKIHATRRGHRLQTESVPDPRHQPTNDEQQIHMGVITEKDVRYKIAFEAASENAVKAAGAVDADVRCGTLGLYSSRLALNRFVNDGYGFVRLAASDVRGLVERAPWDDEAIMRHAIDDFGACAAYSAMEFAKACAATDMGMRME
jgi:hypothetical protein